MIGLGLIDWIIMGTGTVALLAWLLAYLMGLKHNAMFNVLEEKEYPLKEIYGMGYVLLGIFKYKYTSKGDRKLRQELEVLYGKKYSEYYLRVIHSQKITISFTIFVLAFPLYGLSSEIAALIVGVGFAALAYYYCGTVASKKILKRSEELLHDFSDVVSKLALLINAGMILREAWKEIAEDGTGLIYTEMRIAVNEMENGLSDIDALYNFGTRCVVPEIKKFTATIIQGVTKGNRELSAMLQEQSKEVWTLKKHIVRREGAKAASKLLIPICIMFVGILIMIIVPIFTNMGV